MACPYFYPVARFETSSWVVPPRLPLGDPYSGECRAADTAFQPDETRLRQICNLGYGRSRCDRFPERALTDAVRFHVAHDAGELIRNLSSGPDDQILRKQAAAFIESYLRRKG